jgi:small subunit ribosomal protein S17
MSSQVAKAARRVTHELHGVVVSAGLMQKTVKVRVGSQKWNKTVNKVSMIGSITFNLVNGMNH